MHPSLPATGQPSVKQYEGWYKTLEILFHDTLKDIYFAEKKILKTLPKMAKAADNEELKAAFQKHERETAVTSIVSNRCSP